MARVVSGTAAGLLLSCIAAAACAATLGTRGQMIRISHQTGEAGELRIGEDGDFVQLRPSPPLIHLEKGDIAAVAVADANPLLFSYRLELGEPIPTDNYRAITSFMEALEKLVAAWEPAGTPARSALAPLPAEPRLVLGDDLVVAEFLDAARNLVEIKRQIPAYVDRLLAPGNGAVEEVRAEIGSRISDNVAKVRRGLRSLAEIHLGALANGTIHHHWVTPDGTRSTPDPVARLEDIKAPEGLDRQVKTLLQVIEWRAELTREVDLLAEFDARLQRVGRALEIGTVNYDAANRRPATFVVAADTALDALFTEQAKSYRASRTGQFPLTFAPRERLQLAISPGVLYSFVEDPEFSVTGEPGALTIAETQSDPVALKAAVAVNLTPDAWADTGIEPFIQFGVVPDSDNEAVLVGFGFTGFDRVTFAMGAIHQKVKRLASGLRVGDPIARQEDLKTDEDFDTGLYVMVSVRLGD